MTRSALALLALLLACLAAAPAPADAASRDKIDKIINDCLDDGVLQGSYTPGELRDVRQNLPSDVAEYSDCSDVLRRAEIPDRPSSGGGGTGSAQTPGGGFGAGATDGGAPPAPALVRPEPSDKPALQRARKAGAQPVTLGATGLVPKAAVRLDTGANGLPGTLLAALIVLGLAATALALPAVRRLPERIRSRRQ